MAGESEGGEIGGEGGEADDISLVNVNKLNLNLFKQTKKFFTHPPTFHPHRLFALLFHLPYSRSSSPTRPFAPSPHRPIALHAHLIASSPHHPIVPSPHRPSSSAPHRPHNHLIVESSYRPIPIALLSHRTSPHNHPIPQLSRLLYRATQSPHSPIIRAARNEKELNKYVQYYITLQTCALLHHKTNC